MPSLNSGGRLGAVGHHARSVRICHSHGRLDKTMAIIDTLFVVHTTRNVANAGTDAAFELAITGVQMHPVKRPFPDLPHNERERGRTDSYHFDLTGENVDTARGLRFYMRMLGNSGDGWLPRSIFVIGAGPRIAPMVIGWHPDWPRNGWFDTNEPPHPPEHEIGRT
jgi:hypothetical protein